MSTTPKAAPTTIDPTGEFPFDLITYLFHLFAVLGRHREAAMEEAFRPLGLNLARHRALSVVVRMEPCGMSELAEFSAVDRTTMTRTVDQLVAAGLVERETPSTDRRQVLLTVTAAGRSAHRRALQAVYRLNRRALDGLDDAAQRAFARAQQTMLANLIDDPKLVRRLLALERPS
jgi:MarR family transcriptional regulator, lower aerobic nicotinate degradation pathway regulator